MAQKKKRPRPAHKPAHPKDQPATSRPAGPDDALASLGHMSKIELIREILTLRGLAGRSRGGPPSFPSRKPAVANPSLRPAGVSLPQLMPMGTIVYNIKTRFLTATSAVERAFGTTFSLIGGLEQFTRFKALRPDGTVYDPGEWPFARTIATGETVRDEEMHIHKEDGSEAVLLVSSNCAHSTGDSIIIIIKDITRQLALVDAAGRATEDARVLLDASPSPGFVVDTGGSILALNQAFADEHGKPADEMLGQRVYDFYPKGLARYLKSRHEAALRSGKTVRFEFEREGSFYESTVYPVLDESGGVNRLIIHSYDITIRRRMEEELREGQRLQEGLNRIMQGGFASNTEEEVALACLLVAKEITDSRAGFIGEIGSDGLLHGLAISNPGRDESGLTDGHEHPRHGGPFPVRGLYGRILTSGASLVTNHPETHADWAGLPEGHPPMASFLGVPLKEGEKVVGLMALANREGGYKAKHRKAIETLAPAIIQVLLRKRVERTVRESEEKYRAIAAELERRVAERTEELQRAYDRLLEETRQRREIEEQLQQAHKMEAIGTLAGGIAHDFNNMLAVIIGNAELALDEMEGLGNGSAHQIGQILKASERARDLVKQILTFSRRSGSERKPLNLTPIVKETAKLLRGSLPSMIDITFDFDGSPDTVLADPSQVQQVIMNLATNAAHAMREDGGTLTITLSEKTFRPGDPLPDQDLTSGTYVLLTVRDTGVGMAPEVRKRIFEPFYTTKEPGEGTGMGLAVVFGIVRTLNGAVTVESKVGKGSTFSIFLPEFHGATAEERHIRRSLPGGNERVLVVDDEPSVVEIVRATLERLGYQVTTAGGGHEGWKKFSRKPDAYDLVITDHVMPRMTGMRLAEKMLEVRQDIPIILFTGYSETVAPEKAMEAGVSQFLMKPVVASELAETVRRALDRREDA